MHSQGCRLPIRTLSFRIGGLCGNGSSFKSQGGEVCTRAFCLHKYLVSKKKRLASAVLGPHLPSCNLRYQEAGIGSSMRGLPFGYGRCHILSHFGGYKGRGWDNQSCVYCYCTWWGACVCKLWIRPVLLVHDEEELLVWNSKLASWTKVWRKVRWGSLFCGATVPLEEKGS